MASKILKGYGHISGINCGVCGENYMSIEATDDPKEIKLVCWCGASAKGPIDNPSIQAALGSQSSDEVACPDETCSVRLPGDDLQAQAAHMEACHPEIIAQRKASQA